MSPSYFPSYENTKSNHINSYTYVMAPYSGAPVEPNSNGMAGQCATLTCDANAQSDADPCFYFPSVHFSADDDNKTRTDTCVQVRWHHRWPGPQLPSQRRLRLRPHRHLLLDFLTAHAEQSQRQRPQVGQS